MQSGMQVYFQNNLDDQETYCTNKECDETY